MKTFGQYRSEKGSQWKNITSGKSKLKDSKQGDDVVIFIGMLKLKDSEMKPIRGKRLSLRVSKNDDAVTIRIKAENKWKGYYPNLYDKEDFYELTYECGSVIKTLPGTEEPFKLSRYKEELGKDYKRISLYLCSESDIKVKARIDELNDDSSEDGYYESDTKTFEVHLETDNEVTHSTFLKKDLDVPKAAEEDEEEDYGDYEVEKFFETALDTTSKASTPEEITLTVNELTTEEVTILANDCKTFEELSKEKPPNLVLIQRTKNKFWSTLFRNEIDFSKQSIRVVFAGESAVDEGGPFREFLRLSMKYFSVAPAMIFGPPTECLFTADTNSCFQKKYFLLGQLCAVSIFYINRGPECIHPSLVKSLFNMSIGKNVSINDEFFQEHLKEIDSGNYDVLYNANLNPFDRDAKSLYALHYAIVSRYAAISDFKDGVNSISIRILADFNIYSRYFHYNCVNIKAADILNLFLYKNDHDLGSNGRIQEDDAMVELEFTIADIGKAKCGNLTLKDFLVFVTSFDRIPPFGFRKKIDIKFTNINQLATASTCEMSFTIPTVNTRQNILKALEEGLSLNAI